MTGTKTTTLGTGNMLLTTHYYDDYGRIIQSKSQNHIGGTEITDNSYSFTGELESSTRRHTANGQTTTIITTNEYDHVGRLVNSRQQINSQPEITLLANSYNEIGQLRTKTVGADQQGNNPVNTTDYRYNERGWMTSSTSPHFSQQLSYQDPVKGAAAQWNGNISEQQWGATTTLNQHFVYSYDKLNRLTNGSSPTSGMSEILNYDDMGNITQLTRDGSGISYSYTGNRLHTVSGLINGSYSYDENGNAKTDRMGMNLSYNYLNLPHQVTGGGNTITYLYDAGGNKLRKTASTSGQRDYAGGIEYQNGVIELIHTAEGVAYRNANGDYTYRYNLTDHLGNVRATIYRNPGTNTVEVLQRDDYYPFGLQKSPNPVYGNNKYLYNGKEKQEELGGQLDYGARFYDPVIGRWNVVDPHASLYGAHSPYSYGFNNPIKVIDPNGKDGIVTGAGTKDDPFRVKANYYYYDLDEDQIKGLNAAVAQYNNGGKAHSFTDKDGNSYYTVFELNASEISAENIGSAHDIAYKDRIEIDGIERQYGNIISNGQSRKGDFGNATGTTIKINKEMIESALSSNPGGDRNKLIAGTFVHEIGHNLGASHGDPGSIMNQMNMNEIGRGANTIGAGGTGVYNYSYPSVNGNGIRAIMGRVSNPQSLESMYLSPKEVKRIIQHKDPGVPGAIYKVK
ncbi:RHS repeat domain-containing protein [Sphingobacterium spiritivorum]|uniref:RHS repeat domain-containing protein n=1 Tax=Sphingobacterium spiritivorum TaxID=258 RepID=UPI003DA54F5E